MMRTDATIFMLETVARGLAHLRTQVVFIGGAVMSLYIDDPGSPSPRPTEDVDCVVEIATTSDYYKLERELRALGFVNHAAQGSPLCRWTYQGVIVDVMPTDPAILGFSNIWYRSGVAHARQVLLPSGVTISIFRLAYFLAAKFEAFFSRGQGDLRYSHDFEDIIYVLDGCRDAEARLLNSPDPVRQYLADTYRKLAANPAFPESITAHLGLGAQGGVRRERLFRILGKLSATPP